MKISDLTCASCGASYQVAEAASLPGEPGEAHCVMCAALLEQWGEPKLKAFRLMMSAEHRYARVPVPPVSEAFR
jgi:hypothetical protein